MSVFDVEPKVAVATYLIPAPHRSDVMECIVSAVLMAALLSVAFVIS
jgi:hypothetical protein